MARIYKDSSVLNQFGSPSLNSNTIANRPAFGQVGRLFVDTTNNLIYRDTGTSWALIGGSGGSQNLEQVTTLGNTSTKGIFLGLTGSLATGLIFEVSGYSRMEQTVASGTVLGASNVKQFTLQTSGTTITTGNPSPDLNQLFVDIQVAQTINGAGNVQIGAGLFENVISGTDNLLLDISQTVGISALSPIISYQRYINNGDSTISHTAGFVINGLQNTGSGVLSVTDNYQLLINSSQQFATTSIVTNRWGIYQAGANDKNYFAGQTLVNSLTPLFSDDKLYVNGILRATDIVSESTIYTKGTGIRILDAGNIIIGNVANSGRILIVNGEQEWTNITFGTGAHTTSGNHLPIWVNGVQYWLALLNPPILP